MDWQLHNGAGIEWAIALKKHSRYKNIRIIFLISRGEEEFIINNLNIGSDDYVTQPCSPIRMMEFFMTHPDKVFSQEQLLDHIWGHKVYIEERTVDVHIVRLRQTLSEYGCGNLLQTVRGIGYRFSLAA